MIECIDFPDLIIEQCFSPLLNSNNLSNVVELNSTQNKITKQIKGIQSKRLLPPSVSVCVGEAVLPPPQPSVGPARSLCWNTETLQLRGTDQGSGATEAAQSALSYEGPTQCPRNKVT